MDPLAHTLAGVALAEAGIKQRIGKGAVIALVVASNLVDIDIFATLLTSMPNWSFRRMWTHSVFFFPILSLLAAFVFSKIYRQATFRQWALVFGIGAGLHVFMDLINSYGVVLFFPLSRQRFELAWVFIIDLYIWAILLLGLFGPFLLRPLGLNLARRTTAFVSLIGLFAYLAFCGVMQVSSRSMIAKLPEAERATFQYVFPEPFGPWRFRGVLRIDDSYKVFLVEPLKNSITLRKVYHTDESDPRIARLVESANGKLYEWFFKAPIWERKGASSAIVSDLRFKSLLLERTGAFTYLVSEEASLGEQPR